MRLPLIILLITIVSAVVGQKRLSEGTITYTVVNIESDRPIGDSLTAQHFFKGAHTRTDLISKIGRSVTIYDSREANGAILREIGSQRILIPLDVLSWADKNAWYAADSILYSNEESTILGYPCSKATINLRNGGAIDLWFTPSIVLDNKDTEFQMGDLPGVVLKYEFQTENTKLIYVCTNINFDPVPIQRFDIPSSGYRILSYAESKKQQ
jgi:hypothetical protein